jgi:hypothetical protein
LIVSEHFEDKREECLKDRILRFLKSEFSEDIEQLILNSEQFYEYELGRFLGTWVVQSTLRASIEEDLSWRFIRMDLDKSTELAQKGNKPSTDVELEALDKMRENISAVESKIDMVLEDSS